MGVGHYSIPPPHRKDKFNLSNQWSTRRPDPWRAKNNIRWPAELDFRKPSMRLYGQRNVTVRGGGRRYSFHGQLECWHCASTFQDITAMGSGKRYNLYMFQRCWEYGSMFQGIPTIGSGRRHNLFKWSCCRQHGSRFQGMNSRGWRTLRNSIILVLLVRRNRSYV